MCFLHLGSISCLPPYCVAFFFFLGIEAISPECHSAQDSSTLPNLFGLVVLFLHLSSLLVILNCTAYFKCLICLYFR